MFAGANSFDRDLSAWDTSSGRSFDEMFRFSLDFDRNLCAWGEKMDDKATVNEMFLSSACPDRGSPDLKRKVPGPLCYECVAETRSAVTPVTVRDKVDVLFDTKQRKKDDYNEDP